MDTGPSSDTICLARSRRCCPRPLPCKAHTVAAFPVRVPWHFCSLVCEAQVDGEPQQAPFVALEKHWGAGGRPRSQGQRKAQEA